MSRVKSQNASKVLDKLKDELGIDTDAALADHLKVRPNTVSTWRNRDSLPYEQIIAECEGVDLNWLFHGRDKSRSAITPDRGQQLSVTEEIPDDFDPASVAFVPVYGAPLGAGQAGNASMVDVRGYMAWEKTWLRREARIDPTRAFVAQVFGQSMERLISNGDLVLGEMQDVVDHDGVYAVRYEDELFIKHVMRRKHSIVLVSENDIYDRIELGETDDFGIIGRVVAKVGAV